MTRRFDSEKHEHPKRIARGAAYEAHGCDELWVRHFLFDSLEDYLRYLEDTPVQSVFEGACASETGSYEFTETENLEEAIALARYGWHDRFGDMVHLVETVKRAMDIDLDPRRTYHDYVGFAPDVKAYLEGSPLTMIDRPPRPRRRLTVRMNTTCDGSTAPELIQYRGVVVMAMVEVLELMGFSVELILFELSRLENDVHLSEINMKAVDERLNLQKLHFPLCHPSWIRRLNFRLIEVSPGLGVGWAGSYGIPADTAFTQRVLALSEEDIFVPTIDEIGIEGVDIVADAQKLYRLVNRNLPSDKQLVFR